MKLIVANLKDKLKPAMVILHGSYARGTYLEEYSDIDLAIVSNIFQGINVLERFSILSEIFKSSRPRIKAVGFTPEEFLERIRNADPMVLDALNYGVLLYDDDFHHKALETFREVKDKLKLKPIDKGWKWE